MIAGNRFHVLLLLSVLPGCQTSHFTQMHITSACITSITGRAVRLHDEQIAVLQRYLSCTKWQPNRSHREEIHESMLPFLLEVTWTDRAGQEAHVAIALDSSLNPIDVRGESSELVKALRSTYPDYAKRPR